MTNIVGGITQLLKSPEAPLTARLNDRVWADDAPKNATRPYSTIVDGVSISAQLDGDAGDTRVMAREIQGDLWQDSHSEDDELARWFYEALHKKVIPGSPPGVKTKIRVRDVQRFYEEDTHTVHHAFTLVVRHDPTGL